MNLPPASTKWLCPIPLQLVRTAESESFREHGAGVTGLPVAPHPGGFGVVRANHVHEGVDLYCATGTPVFAVEAGTVVAVLPFTGPKANLPHWLDTDVVLVEGASGVVAYGEIEPHVRVGEVVAAGAPLGEVIRVLRNDKGRPMSMLHLELYEAGTRDVVAKWELGAPQPVQLRDPTCFLEGVALPREAAEEM